MTNEFRGENLTALEIRLSMMRARYSWSSEMSSMLRSISLISISFIEKIVAYTKSILVMKALNG